MISWKWAMALAAALPSVVGCCGHVRTYTAPAPRDLLSEVNRHNRSLRSIRAKAKADQLTRKGRVNVTVYLLVQQPGKLRFEATVLDNTVAVLTSDGTRFASIDFKKHVAYRGPASPCNIARIFKIPLSPDHVGLVLMGGVPVLRHDEVVVAWDRCNGAEVLTLKDKQSGLSQKIRVKKRHGRWMLLGSRIYDRKGRRLVRLRFKRFRRKGGRWMPHLIHFEMSRPETDVLIRFDKLAANVEIPAKAFTLDPPGHLPEHWLTCPAIERIPFLPVAPAKPLPGPPVSSSGLKDSVRSGSSTPPPAKRTPGRVPPTR